MPTAAHRYRRIVLSLTAKGLTTGKVGANFADGYGNTDKVIGEMTDWCNRPLEPVYPVVSRGPPVVR
jgi:putative transposase